MALDADLRSIQEARESLRLAAEAREKLVSMTQEQIDKIVQNMSEAGQVNAKVLAKMAVEETGFGVYEDKITKNMFASKTVFDAIIHLKTVGIIHRDQKRRIVEIAEPMGIIVGLVPSTNPTSTVLYKSLISIKARNPIVFSPHPSAVMCTGQAAEIMADAACAAGAPRDSIQCLSSCTKQATSELMHHDETALILATGGSGMVKAAYSAGKPAYGVGPGNVPAFIERTANIGKAVSDIIASRTFDNGTICASEESLVTESAIEDEVIEELRAQGGWLVSDSEADALGKLLVFGDGRMNSATVGRDAMTIARMAGIRVPEGTKVLVARIGGVGPAYPLSREKLCSVLAFYVESNWQTACERCIEILKLGGIGHSLVIHSRDEAVIREFALKKPVFRVLVNTPATHGAIGLNSGLEPALTLGPGTWGGSITSDNVGPMHLLNKKRVAYGMGVEEVRGLYEQEGIAKGVHGAYSHGSSNGRVTAARPGSFGRKGASYSGVGRQDSDAISWNVRGSGKIPKIIGPAASVDKPILHPSLSRGIDEAVPGQQTVENQQRESGNLVSDEDIRKVVQGFLAELRGRGGMTGES